MWKRRVKVWGFLGAKMLSKAIRQYNRASALSQRRSSLQEETDFSKEKEKKKTQTIPATLLDMHFFPILRDMVTKVEEISKSCSQLFVPCCGSHT